MPIKYVKKADIYLICVLETNGGGQRAQAERSEGGVGQILSEINLSISSALTPFYLFIYFFALNTQHGFIGC